MRVRRGLARHDRHVSPQSSARLGFSLAAGAIRDNIVSGLIKSGQIIEDHIWIVEADGPHIGCGFANSFGG